MERHIVESAAEGDIREVRKALKGGSNVDFQNEFGDTALMEAAKHGHLDIVRLLLDRGADVNARNRLGRSALMCAASLGHAEIVAVLLDAGAYVNATDKHGDNALTQASGQIAAVKVLLEHGADANWRNLVGTNSLMRAAKYGHKKVLKLLIAHGADVNGQNVNGSTALMRATAHGHAAIARELLRFGAEIDRRDRDEGTALMRAAAKGKLEVVQVLLSGGADLYARDKHGATPLSFAAMSGHADVVKALIESSPPQSPTELMRLNTDDFGDSPLIIAARLGHLDVVRLFVDSLEKDRNSDSEKETFHEQLNHRNRQGDTPLIEAARRGRYEIAQALLEKGADAQTKNSSGETALMVAPLDGDCRLFNLLLEYETAYRDHGSRDSTKLLAEDIQPLPIEDDQTDLDEEAGDCPTRSKIMHATVSAARQAAESNSAVLILGESGSGKDFLAQYIHKQSPWAEGPFRSMNCAALPRELAESELFGHEKGAFTGATDRKRGVFEVAHGGTVFLNEIGDMPLESQAKLLTFLDTHRFQRVGGEKEIESDARIIAATNRDLNKAVAGGKFRLDLYHRLAVWPIKVPPLRERIEDIPLLAKVLLSDLCANSGMNPPKVSQSALHKLRSHTWEGNVRELKNVLERALILCKGNTIDSEHIHLNQAYESVKAYQNTALGKGTRRTKPTASELRTAYSEYIVKQVWTRARLAKQFGVDSSTLKKWFRDAGLPAGSPGRPKKKQAE